MELISNFLQFPGLEPGISGKRARHYLNTTSTAWEWNAFKSKICCRSCCDCFAVEAVRHDPTFAQAFKGFCDFCAKNPPSCWAICVMVHWSTSTKVDQQQQPQSWLEVWKLFNIFSFIGLVWFGVRYSPDPPLILCFPPGPDFLPIFICFISKISQNRVLLFFLPFEFRPELLIGLHLRRGRGHSFNLTAGRGSGP